MQKVTPFLWFDDQAEEAARFYTSVFAAAGAEASRIVTVARYGDGAPGPKGSVMTVKFLLAGQEFIALNGGPRFHFDEAISFVVNCETQEELDTYWEKLTEGGTPVQCGWLKDKYGLSWQIVPTVLGEWMSDQDPERSGRVMQAMLQMVKLDIEELKRAHERR